MLATMAIVVKRQRRVETVATKEPPKCQDIIATTSRPSNRGGDNGDVLCIHDASIHWSIGISCDSTVVGETRREHNNFRRSRMLYNTSTSDAEPRGTKLAPESASRARSRCIAPGTKRHIGMGILFWRYKWPCKSDSTIDTSEFGDFLIFCCGPLPCTPRRPVGSTSQSTTTLGHS